MNEIQRKGERKREGEKEREREEKIFERRRVRVRKKEIYLETEREGVVKKSRGKKRRSKW